MELDETTLGVRRYIDLVAEAARRFPGATAVVGNDTQLTFAELDRRVDQLGAALHERGVATGARVALLAANELEYLEVQGACVRYGYTLVPLNTRLAAPELAYILKDSSPDALLAGRQDHDRGRQLGDDLGIAWVAGLGDTGDGVDAYDAALDAAGPPPAVPDDPDLPTTILYTSGTTGRPKGAVITRRGFMARVFVNALELEATDRDVFQQSLPMFHIAAFLAYAYLYRGGTLVMLTAFEPAACLASFSRHKVTSTVLVPTMIDMLLESPEIADYDPGALELIIYGGSSIDPPLLRRAIDRFQCGFHQQYGMTETGAQTILRPVDHVVDDENRLSSGGTPAVSFEVRVVDPQDRSLPTGEVGEVVCTGPAVMSGYWNLPDATAQTLRNGWMHTGDMGYIDEQGLLHIVDRRNDMIVSGGENVYPREVEAVLADLEELREVAVVGLPHPRWGQQVTGVVPHDAPDDDVLDAFLRERIAGYKVPRRWVRVDEIPRNVTGKILKTRLREQLEALAIEPS